MNLASDILRHSSALFCDILLQHSPDSSIFSDMREICGSFFQVRILAGGSCEMRESPAECVRVGNYALGNKIGVIFILLRRNIKQHSHTI